MTVEADIGMMLPQTKESWQLAEVGRGKEWILPLSIKREAGTGDTNPPNPKSLLFFLKRKCKICKTQPIYRIFKILF